MKETAVTKKNLEASIDVDATPEQAWTMLSDLKRMPEWSPQCTAMWPLGALREGTITVNMNRQGRKYWPTASKVVRLEPNRAIAFRTLTNNSVWTFEITPTTTGSRLTETRTVPADGTTWVSETIVAHVLGGEEDFDAEMLDGMNATLANIKAAVERTATPKLNYS
jgi:uncharacterized protein YndB with AHSA1/START domain